MAAVSPLRSRRADQVIADARAAARTTAAPSVRGALPAPGTGPARRSAARTVEGPSSRPGPGRLRVVPPRRRVVAVAVVSCAVLFALLLGAVAFQTQLAQNQLALDTTERAVREASARYDILRRQRAQLRSPNRLAVEAARLGMTPAATGELMTIEPAVVAAVAAAASGLPEDVADDQGTSLEQFGAIKALTGDAP
ncbi:MAG: hypothetical protein ABIW84_07775 [Ilumatobacteraceae bacterium]